MSAEGARNAVAKKEQEIKEKEEALDMIKKKTGEE